MSDCYLFIDGENFRKKINDVLKEQGVEKSSKDIALIQINKLIKDPLKSFTIFRKIFYASKLHSHPDTKKKSEELIKAQRKLRNNLIEQGFEFAIAGNVRAQKIGDKIIFREKGVDVKIAVDLISLACDKKIKTAILCSSDSDLQPAISELKSRGVEIIYLGFETSPNRGLSFTANRTILLRNHEVIEALKNGNV